MSFLRKLFGGQPSPYVPGQTEPQEYTRWLAELVGLNQLNTLGYRALIVGFDDSENVLTIVERRAELDLHSTSVREGLSFKQRNPVVECRYPLDGEQEAIVEDARTLKEHGATDLSAVGVNMATALKLRDIFGQKSCPFLAVTQ